MRTLIDGDETVIADRMASSSSVSDPVPESIIGKKRSSSMNDIEEYDDHIIVLAPLVDTLQEENIGFDIDTVLVQCIGAEPNELNPDHVWDKETGVLREYYWGREIGRVVFDFTDPTGKTTRITKTFVVAKNIRESFVKVVCLLCLITVITNTCFVCHLEWIPTVRP
jgi:hypothetical protein